MASRNWEPSPPVLSCRAENAEMAGARLRKICRKNALEIRVAIIDRELKVVFHGQL